VICCDEIFVDPIENFTVIVDELEGLEFGVYVEDILFELQKKRRKLKFLMDLILCVCHSDCQMTS
jgi:hypothetical protein